MTASRAVRTAIVIAVVLVVAVALVYLYMLLNRGDTSSAYPAQAQSVAYRDEAVVFEDLGVMTASSDLVVRGTVLGATPGLTHHYPEEAGGPETDRDLAVRVDEVLYNRHEAPVPARIVVVEGWWADGEGFAWEGMPWSEEGDAGYFYLVGEEGSEPQDPYSYVSSSGRVLVDTEGIHPSGDRGAAPWASLSTSAKIAAVDSVAEQAAKSARSGRARSAPEPARAHSRQSSQRTPSTTPVAGHAGYTGIVATGGLASVAGRVSSPRTC